MLCDCVVLQKVFAMQMLCNTLRIVAPLVQTGPEHRS